MATFMAMATAKSQKASGGLMPFFPSLAKDCNVDGELQGISRSIDCFLQKSRRPCTETQDNRTAVWVIFAI